MKFIPEAGSVAYEESKTTNVQSTVPPKQSTSASKSQAAGRKKPFKISVVPDLNKQAHDDRTFIPEEGSNAFNKAQEATSPDVAKSNPAIALTSKQSTASIQSASKAGRKTLKVNVGAFFDTEAHNQRAFIPQAGS